MANINLDPQTRNDDIGIFVTESHLIPQADWNIDFGFLATIIKAEAAGTIVWYNKHTDETGAWIFEAGEPFGIACTAILASATIDGEAYATSLSRNQIWIAATANGIAAPNV